MANEGDPMRPTEDESSLSDSQRTLPWFFFVMTSVILSSLVGYFARQGTVEAQRAGSAEEQLARARANIKDLNYTIEQLQRSTQSLSNEVRKATSDRDDLLATLKEREAKCAGPRGVDKKPLPTDPKAVAPPLKPAVPAKQVVAPKKK
jgi:hypothetical protein